MHRRITCDPSGGYGTLPEQPTFGAIYNDRSTNAAFGRHILDQFREHMGPGHIVRTTPDRNETHHAMRALFEEGLDVALVLGGDGLLNAAAQAHMSTSSHTALAPGKTGGASDGHFMTQGARFRYAPEGFAGQSVGYVRPLDIAVSPFCDQEEVRVTALLYASIGGLITRAADIINSPGHRSLLRASQGHDPLVGKVLRRTAEATAIVRAIGVPRFILGDEHRSNARMVSDYAFINGGRIAGVLGTPGNLLDPELTHVLETHTRPELLSAAGRLLLGQTVQSLDPRDTAIKCTILTGQEPGATSIQMMFDGETILVPTRSLVTACHSELEVPLVFASEILRRSLRERAQRKLHWVRA